MIALLAVAASFWGVPQPPCGPVTVTNGDLSANPGHYADGTAGWADPASCTITLDPRARVSERDDCILLTHEYGHLLGLAHDGARDVMNPAAMYGPDTVPQCEGNHHAPRPHRAREQGRRHRPRRTPRRDQRLHRPRARAKTRAPGR